MSEIKMYSLVIANIGQKFSASNIASSAILSNASVQSTGTNSGMGADSLGGKATLFANYYESVMFDVADNGKPLCQNRKNIGLHRLCKSGKTEQSIFFPQPSRKNK